MELVEAQSLPPQKNNSLVASFYNVHNTLRDKTMGELEIVVDIRRLSVHLGVQIAGIGFISL